MSGKIILLCVCSMLAISAARAQLCGSVQPTYNVQSSGLGLLGNAGLGIGSGSCGLSSGIVNGGLLGGAGLGYGSQGVDALSIATGSSYAPNGISLYAQDLEIAGPLAVSGAYPILGAVSFGGNLPTGGQGQVSYSTAPGVALGSGGCGYGLASAQPNIALSGVSGVSGVSGINGLLSASQLGLSSSGCGCGRY